MFSAPAFRASLSAVLLVYPCYGALAEENEDIRIRVGLGGQVRPDYLGSDGTEWAPLWDLAVARGSNQFEFEAPDDSFDIKLYSKDGFSFGPAASIAGGRNRSDVGARVDKLSTTIEVGAFAQYYVSDSIRLRAETRKGIGGHGGVVASLGADHVWRKGDDYVFSIGPRLLLSDARYQRAWFGVDASSAINSGLPQYRPDGGIHAVGATGGATYRLSPRWGLFGFGRYERLVGDVAKSPIVRELGSRDQFSAGAGLTYSFTIRR